MGNERNRRDEQEAMKEDIRQIVTEHVEASSMDNLDAANSLRALGRELEEMYHPRAAGMCQYCGEEYADGIAHLAYCEPPGQDEE